MIKAVAHINELGKVINLVAIDTDAMDINNLPPHLIDIKENQFCDIGFTWDGQNFVDDNGKAYLYDEET